MRCPSLLGICGQCSRYCGDLPPLPPIREEEAGERNDGPRFPSPQKVATNHVLTSRTVSLERESSIYLPPGPGNRPCRGWRRP